MNGTTMLESDCRTKPNKKPTQKKFHHSIPPLCPTSPMNPNFAPRTITQWENCPGWKRPRWYQELQRVLPLSTSFRNSNLVSSVNFTWTLHTTWRLLTFFAFVDVLVVYQQRLATLRRAMCSPSTARWPRGSVYVLMGVCMDLANVVPRATPGGLGKVSREAIARWWCLDMTKLGRRSLTPGSLDLGEGSPWRCGVGIVIAHDGLWLVVDGISVSDSTEAGSVKRMAREKQEHHDNDWPPLPLYTPLVIGAWSGCCDKLREPQRPFRANN